MTATRYVVGDSAVLDATFTVDDVATDPATVTLTVTTPGGTPTTYTYAAAQITRVSTGVYRKSVASVTQGTWSFLWTGTSPAADTQSGTFDVFPVDPVVTNYCTLDELKNEKGIGDTVDDLTLQLSINGASRMIDGWCGQRFWLDTTAVARLFDATSSTRLCLNDDGFTPGIGSTSGLIVALDTDDTGTYETTLTSGTDFYLHPRNAAADVPARPYTELMLTGVSYLFTASSYGRPLIQITAKWGWPAVPDDIRKAALIQAGMLAKAKDAAFGIAALAGIDGIGMRASAWNPLARSLIAPYAKPAIG